MCFKSLLGNEERIMCEESFGTIIKMILWLNNSFSVDEDDIDEGRLKHRNFIDSNSYTGNSQKEKKL